MSRVFFNFFVGNIAKVLEQIRIKRSDITK